MAGVVVSVTVTMNEAAPMLPRVSVAVQRTVVASSVACGGTVIAGPIVSATVTVNDAAPLLPWASVAVQRTVVAARGNVVPLAGVHVAATLPSTASLAVAV